MLTRALSTTALQILCTIIPNSKGIAKSMIDADDNFEMNISALMG